MTHESGLVPAMRNPFRTCVGVREYRARNGPGLPCMGSPIEKEHDPSHQSQSQAVSAVLLGFRDESLLQLFPHRRAMIKRLGNSLPKLRDQGALIPIGEEVPLFGSQSGIIGTEDLP